MKICVSVTAVSICIIRQCVLLWSGMPLSTSEIIRSRAAFFVDIHGRTPLRMLQNCHKRFHIGWNAHRLLQENIAYPVMSAKSPPVGCGTPTEIVFRGIPDLRGQEHSTSASTQGKFKFFKFLISSFIAAALRQHVSFCILCICTSWSRKMLH